MKKILSGKNLFEAFRFALAMAVIDTIGMMGFIQDQRYDMAAGVLQTTVPMAFVARLLSPSVVPFDRHPIITTSSVFASICVVISVVNQSIIAPETNHLAYNLMSFAACFGVATLAGLLSRVLEVPWLAPQTHATA